MAPKHFIPTEDIDCEIISDEDDNEMIDEFYERNLRRGY